jgi:hypothetical protein
MDKPGIALKTATVLGFISGLPVLLFGYLFILIGLFLYVGNHHLTADGLQCFKVGIPIAAVGATGMISGVVAFKKPALACSLQLIMAVLISLYLIDTILGPAYLEGRITPQIFLVWPGLYWIGGTLLLNYGRGRVNNIDNMPYKRAARVTRNIGFIGSTIAILWAMCLIIYGVIWSLNGSINPLQWGPLNVFVVSGMLLVTSLINLAASFVVVNQPKRVGVILIISSVIQAGWFMLTFLASSDDRMYNLGLVWLLWVPFQLIAAYKAIKLNQLK